MGWDGGPEVSVASNWRDRSERKEMQTTGAGPGTEDSCPFCQQLEGVRMCEGVTVSECQVSQPVTG